MRSLDYSRCSLLGSLALLASLLFASITHAQTAFVYGAEPIHVPSEMPPVTQMWQPTNQHREPGIYHGEPFNASLVRVFNEDTQWTSEMAVFRFKDGSVRAWKTRSFSLENVKVMRAMKAKAPVPPMDRRTWTTKLDDRTRKLLSEKQLNQYETHHFVFLWGNERIDEVRRSMDSPKFIERAGEWFEKVWSAFEVDLRAPMPWSGNNRPERIVVRLYGTGIPGLERGYANAADAMAINPIAIHYGSTVVPHEFGHVVQFYSGGFRDRPSVGPFWEVHAEACSFLFAPVHGDFNQMLANVTHGYQWPESRYANWHIVMHLWEKKRTQNLVFGAWTQNQRERNGASLEDQMETTVRIGKANGSLPKGWDSFQEEIGEMAARMVTMDYINQGFLADASIEQRRKTMSKVSEDPASQGWFDSPPDRKLYAYGFQWIPVNAQGGNPIQIAFRGLSKDKGARWKLTLVAVNENNVARYSPRVTANGTTEAKVEMKLKPGERCVLVVAATPAQYRTLTWNQTPEFDYPYKIQPISGTFSLFER